MNIFDLSYKGINLSFQCKNGLTSPQAFSPADGEFAEQCPSGMLVTYGLNRQEAVEQGKIAVLPAYSSVENHLELGILDGITEIREFLRNL